MSHFGAELKMPINSHIRPSWYKTYITVEKYTLKAAKLWD